MGNNIEAFKLKTFIISASDRARGLKNVLFPCLIKKSKTHLQSLHVKYNKFGSAVAKFF